jgi:hypothetical protein
MSEASLTCRELQAAIYMISLGVMNNPGSSQVSRKELATAFAGAVGMYLASGLSLENWLWDHGIEVDSILRPAGVKRFVDLMSGDEPE